MEFHVTNVDFIDKNNQLYFLMFIWFCLWAIYSDSSLSFWFSNFRVRFYWVEVDTKEYCKVFLKEEDLISSFLS